MTDGASLYEARVSSFNGDKISFETPITSFRMHFHVSSILPLKLGTHNLYKLMGLFFYTTGTYEGQWIKGVRHGYGVRKSVPYGRAAMCRLPNTRKTSLTSVRSEVESSDHPPPDPNDPLADEGPVSHPSARLGFFLKEKGDETTANQNSGANRNQSPLTAAFEAATRESANRQGADGGKTHGDDSGGEVNADGSPKTSKVEIVPDTAVETYSGEWRNDKRSGFGVATRSDGLRYEGEWSNNCKNGFGMTTFCDGTKEEGCYKNNVLQAPGKRLALLRAAKLREQVESAVASAQRTSQIALQKAGIATSRSVMEPDLLCFPRLYDIYMI